MSLRSDSDFLPRIALGNLIGISAIAQPAQARMRFASTTALVPRGATKPLCTLGVPGHLKPRTSLTRAHSGDHP